MKLEIKHILLYYIVVLFFISCNKSEGYKAKLNISYKDCEPRELAGKRYDQALFKIDTANFAEGLKAIQNEFVPFLTAQEITPRHLEYLKNFVTDTFCIRVNKMVQEKFKDVSDIDESMKRVYQHFHYYYPEIELPPVYYYISGIDYESSPVMMGDKAMLVSLDYYLGGDNSLYDYVGMPRFRSARCWPAYISRDLAESLYLSYIYKSRIQKDLLTEMINEGKQLYFFEAMNPSMPDSVLLGYTSDKMRWAEKHEGDIWAAIVGNDMLYSKGLDMYRNFFGDGPFTAAFSNNSPSRLGKFIGLQIVRSYMTNNDITLQQLMKLDDIQTIFQNSRYKPK